MKRPVRRWTAQGIALFVACALCASCFLWFEWGTDDALENGVILLALVAGGLTALGNVIPSPEDDERRLGALPSKIRQWQKLREGQKSKR